MTANAERRVLLVEDNAVDIKATLKAAERLGIAHIFDVAETGEEALDHLRRAGASGRRPDLVLLDLNLPGRDGRDVLAEMKGDAELRRVPVVVLTTSSADVDILDAYELGANAYIAKPIGLDRWVEVLTTIAEFWLTLAELP